MGNNESLRGKCLTCLGLGEVGSVNGPVRCGDCDGSGRPPRRHLLTERRIREIENAVRRDESDMGTQTRWLAFELRRARESMMKILTLVADDPGESGALQKIWYEANDVLGVFEPEIPGATARRVPIESV